MEKGDAVFYKCKEEKMIGCKYRAKKDKASGKQKVVYLLSTCHQPLMQEVDAYGRDNTPVFKPATIKCYNQHMGSVDRVDQQLNSLQTLCKTYKWYCKLAIRLICQSALNAHKVYQAYTGKKETFTEFLHDLIVLLRSSTAPRIQQQIIEDDTHARLTGRHFIDIRKPAPGAKDQRPTKECHICRATGKRTDKGGIIKTVYICPDCPSQPGLHPGDCFRLYHTQLDYSKKDA